MLWWLSVLCGIAVAGKTASNPTHADVVYGPAERNQLDVWLPRGAAGPVPVVVWFHGGGFVRGDKRRFDPRPLLERGFAVVSANYRFVDGKKTISPAPMEDGARVVQFVRTHADEWGVDPERMATSGSSAGGVIALWVGLHDDLADPEAEDPVARASSRVALIAPMDAPTNLDPQFVRDTLGGPRAMHPIFADLFGVSVKKAMKGKKGSPERIAEASAVTHVSPDDPEVLLVYRGAPEPRPLPEDASADALVHHAYFGVHLRDRLVEAGVDAELETGVPSKERMSWVAEKLDQRW